MRKVQLWLFGLFLVLMAVQCTTPKQPAPVAKLPAVCGAADARAALGKYEGFEVRADGTNGLKVEKSITAPDGQIIGYESHHVKFWDHHGQCQFQETSAERVINGDLLVNDFVAKQSRFYKLGQLVYEDTALEDGAWLRRYAQLTMIPVDVPNWAVKDRKDLYLTWVARDEGTASRVPVWGYEVIWVGSSEDPTIMAGRVVFMNPNTGPKTADLVTMARLDSEGVVNTRGVLFPVSDKTWTAYLDHMKGKANVWQRDLLGDAAAFKEFKKESASKAWRRHARLDLATVYARRDTPVAPLPKIRPGFLPAFDAVPPLAR